MEGNKSLIGEIWDYLKIRKRWWLLQIIIMLILIAPILIIFGSSDLLNLNTGE